MYVSCFDYEHNFPSCVYSKRCMPMIAEQYCIICNTIPNRSSNKAYLNARWNLVIIVYTSMPATKYVWRLAYENWIVKFLGNCKNSNISDTIDWLFNITQPIDFTDNPKTHWNCERIMPTLMLKINRSHSATGDQPCTWTLRILSLLINRVHIETAVETWAYWCYTLNMPCIYLYCRWTMIILRWIIFISILQMNRSRIYTTDEPMLIVIQ